MINIQQHCARAHFFFYVTNVLMSLNTYSYFVHVNVNNGPNADQPQLLYLIGFYLFRKNADCIFMESIQHVADERGRAMLREGQEVTSRSRDDVHSNRT